LRTPVRSRSPFGGGRPLQPDARRREGSRVKAGGGPGGPLPRGVLILAEQVAESESELTEWDRTRFWDLVLSQGARVGARVSSSTDGWTLCRTGWLDSPTILKPVNLCFAGGCPQGGLARLTNRGPWSYGARRRNAAAYVPVGTVQTMVTDILRVSRSPMLAPSDRSLLHDHFRPPEGYRFSSAVGTTYSLDLVALMTVPLAFTFFDAEAPEDERDGDDQLAPLALLEALRRQAAALTVFCHAGAIYVPSRQRPLFAF